MSGLTKDVTTTFKADTIDPVVKAALEFKPVSVIEQVLEAALLPEKDEKSKLVKKLDTVPALTEKIFP